MAILSSDLRSKYLEFFRSKEHAVIESAPLVPENDPSVLFNTAGMQPLVPYLLGRPHPMGQRIADVQKCVRTGDIDDIGDNTHLSFFEMLGNWSLGDYFKKESIEWSYEFLTDPKWLGLNPSWLAVTVFEGDTNAPRDEESAAIWKSLGIPENRISYLPAEDNWWAAGPTGPCGPDTEIFYWVGEGEPDPESNVGKEPKKWMEIWNNVFMEYNRTAEGVLEKLPAQNVDTGMGLERITATLNHKKTVYETDIFADVLARIREIVGQSAYVERSARIIADHLRAATHMISDGVVPKNVDQGYILRRLVRRAIREFFKMGYERPVITEIAKIYIAKFRDVYQSIRMGADRILDELSKEEERFAKTLKNGLRELEKVSDQVDGKTAFDLFQTYGLPPEMIRDELATLGKPSFDQTEFDSEFSKHQDLSRAGSEQKFKGGLADTSDATVRLHSATHLMLDAMREILGEHVHQAGSNITVERLRFDFTHHEKLTEHEKQTIEARVNEAIRTGFATIVEQMPKDEARAQGVEGSFWEKYPEIVTVYTMRGVDGRVYSRELCGGPHVESSEGMGTFRILKEEASSAGVRRIKAVLE
ncbi:MAG TPA: alanine--tRNA ligase [bacterium]|nr:alanine--tRNA ligase [bacterium]